MDLHACLKCWALFAFHYILIDWSVRQQKFMVHSKEDAKRFQTYRSHRRSNTRKDSFNDRQRLVNVARRCISPVVSLDLSMIFAKYRWPPTAIFRGRVYMAIWVVFELKKVASKMRLISICSSHHKCLKKYEDIIA